MKNLSQRWPILLLLAAYMALAVAYSLASPPYEPTDEIRHFRYVRHIVVYHGLPVQSAEGPRAQSHHPPLYYALGALVSWWVDVEQEVYYEPPENPKWDTDPWEVGVDNKNKYLHGDDERFPFRGVTLAVYVVRAMTVLLGAGVVWLTYRTGREIFPDQPALAVGGAAMIAFNPQFVYMSGAINNDIAATLCSAAVLWTCVRLVRNGPNVRTDLTLGILYGLALLTKFHLLALLAPIGLAYAIVAWPTRTHPASPLHSRTTTWRGFLIQTTRHLLVVLGLTALIAGWWFWRNQALYGDPTGMSKVNELWFGRPASEGLWAVPQSLPYLWSSVWGRFGYGQLPLPQIIYQGLLVFCALALAGHLIPRRDPRPLSALALLGITVLVFTLVVFYYIAIQPAGPMGRFLFPCLPAFVLLLMAGLGRFFPARLTWAAGAVVAIAMATLAVYALVGVLAPAFARPHPLTASEIEAMPNSTDVELGGVTRLLGYQVTPTAVKPGDAIEVTIYWQPLVRTEQDHVIFVHLLSDEGVMIAQRDTFPGLGRYPSTAWEPGVAFADTYRVRVPETAYAPDRGYVQVGLYPSDGGPRLTTADGRDAVRLVAFEVLPLPGEFPNPVSADFGHKIVLVGYALDRRVARPGETIRLTLYWRSLDTTDVDYRVFAHVLGAEDQIWANDTGHPVPATSDWSPGQVVKDVRALTLGLTTPSGFYDIEVGLHARGVGRLKVVAEDGHLLDKRVLLCRIRVMVDE